ncbi:MAG: hypothetical protein KA146_00890 [Leptospiraceae bacterium]|jgi:hypothetical protein|nr:hypothetical protein [Leptospiraceae bacterium]
MNMTLDVILLEIAKLDYVDQQSLSTFLIDLVHTQEKMQQAMANLEKEESRTLTHTK